MRKYFRNRFIMGAMLSFLILILLMITFISLFSYHQVEQESSRFIEMMLSGTGEEGKPQSEAAPPMFGYRPEPRPYPSGFYDITVNAEGTIESVQQRGIFEETEVDMEETVRQILRDKFPTGKIGSYKYGLFTEATGQSRIILLDISIQLKDLYNVLKSTLLTGALLMVALFLILLPISSRVADAYMRNTEKQKQFITDAGHDLKTPVAIIRSSLDVLDLTQGKSKWSENIRSQTNRLERLIAQLLLMARLDESAEAMTRQKLDFTSLIQEEVSSFISRLEERQIRWKTTVASDLHIQGDEGSMRNMLNLLIDNAAQYTADNGEFFLSAALERKKIRLEISNTVDSLPDVRPDQLTDRFVRGNSSRNSGGTGIGLSAAKRITEIHHGSLSIQYPDAHTFRVLVSLPAA